MPGEGEVTVADVQAAVVRKLELLTEILMHGATLRRYDELKSVLDYLRTLPSGPRGYAAGWEMGVLYRAVTSGRERLIQAMYRGT